MRIKEKINMEYNDLVKNGPINIVAFGDSVTHGALGSGEINYETVYWNRLKQKINNVRNYVPVNVINAGIGGITANGSLERMEKQVFAHNPDLVIVCFGLNDVNGPIERYLEALTKIFERCNEADVETVFMTPNMLNTSVADDTADIHREYAKRTAEIQNGGRMDKFMNAACELAESMDIKVCDCYSEWKKLSETQDITYLLANRINHPIKEMHELFAQKLFETIFDEETKVENLDNNTMYKE